MEGDNWYGCQTCGQRRTILNDQLSLALSAPFPGLVADLPYRWKQQVSTLVSDWATMSDACANGLHEAIERVEEP
jgi:hypothetical protein